MDLVSKIEAFVGDRYQVNEYPVLQYQFEEWRLAKPLFGISVVDSTPLFYNTLLKHRSLIAAGARLTIGLSDFISYDKSVLDFVRNELKLNVIDAPVGSYDVVADCAAAYCDLEALFGYVELTRSGVEKYAAKGVRTYVADSSIIKRVETEIGTGDSYFRAMAQLGYDDWKGKKMTVFGSGKVGRGIASQARSKGVEVVVVSDPATSTLPVIDYRDRAASGDAVKKSDFVVMATGVASAFENTVDVEDVINCGAVFANMGAEDEFGPGVDEKYVLCGKRTLNFILSEPTQMCYIDATMALHNYGVVFLVNDISSRGLILPDRGVEQSMLYISARDGIISSQISTIINL